MIDAVAKQSSVSNETKVSSESRFSDIEWQMARGVSGYPDTTFRIDWAFTLPDGSGFDEGRWDKLRYAAKAFIWSLHSDLMRWMPPFIGHRMMLSSAMSAHEGGAYGECTHAVDRPGKAQLPGLRD